MAVITSYSIHYTKLYEGSVQALNRFSVSGDITIGASDDIVVLAVNTAAAREITLPSVSAVSDGRFYIVIDEYGSAYDNNITLTPNGSDTINGESSLVIDSSYSATWVIADGTSNWLVA